VRYTEQNIEDWDFRSCYPDAPNYDAEADLFLSENYTTVLAVDTERLSLIKALVDRGVASIEDDRQHVRLARGADASIGGWKSGSSRFTSEGRFARNVAQAVRNEGRRYGRLRISILPTSIATDR
jgi:hypothetical protein